MATVITEGGRSVDLPAPTGTIGACANTLVEAADGRQFSFKVDGQLIHPETKAEQVALRDDNVIELVEVTGQAWPTAPDEKAADVPTAHAHRGAKAKDDADQDN